MADEKEKTKNKIALSQAEMRMIRLVDIVRLRDKLSRIVLRHRTAIEDSYCDAAKQIKMV